MDNITKHFIEKFLNFGRIQNLLAKENLDEVYAIWDEEFSNSPATLTQWFLANDIDPLLYMSKVYYDMYMFMDIDSIEIPNNITEIQGNAFAGCHNLKEVIIPNSVKSIGSSAFHHCSNLTTVTIPSSVTEFGEDIFRRTPIDVIYCEKDSAAHKYFTIQGKSCKFI